MQNATLKPYLRENLDILFVGLNPAKGSNDNHHYFSVNQSFWKQLTESGLLNESISKDTADITVFGSNNINYKGWCYGITDLVTEIAESNSRNVKIEDKHCIKLFEDIRTYNPKVVIFLHQKATKTFLKFLHHSPQKANCGCLGKIIPDCDSMIFSIGFPHGSSIPSIEKVAKYIEVKEYINKLIDNS